MLQLGSNLYNWSIGLVFADVNGQGIAASPCDGLDRPHILNNLEYQEKLVCWCKLYWGRVK